MLATLFPRAHVRYSSLPIVGEALEGLCVWLHARGYPRDAIQRRMQAAASLARALRRRGVCSLGELTASALRSYAPPPRRSGSPARGALVRSLASSLEERGSLAPTPLTPSELLVADYQRFLDRVRGLSASTIVMHGGATIRFLCFLGYDANPRCLRDLGNAKIEAFTAHTGRQVGRSRMVSLR